jgi:DNA-binding NarL/FixJ family response regulator
MSARERESVEAIARGRSNASIAADLHLGVSTVKNHVSAVLGKLTLDNRVQIALMVQDAQRR